MDPAPSPASPCREGRVDAGIRLTERRWLDELATTTLEDLLRAPPEPGTGGEG